MKKFFIAIGFVLALWAIYELGKIDWIEVIAFFPYNEHKPVGSLQNICDHSILLTFNGKEEKDVKDCVRFSSTTGVVEIPPRKIRN